MNEKLKKPPAFLEVYRKWSDMYPKKKAWIATPKQPDKRGHSEEAPM